MKELRRILVAVLIGMMLSVGAFAQKSDNRPPKETPGKVVDKEKDKPPPSNSNQSNNNRGKKP